MAVTNYNMRKAVEETIKVAEKAIFEATRAHARIDALPTPEPPVAPQKGDRGPAGTPGRDGTNGRDGRDAVGIPGPQGRPGRDCQCKLELAEQTIIRLEQKLAESNDAIAAVRQEFADLKLVVNAIYDQNRHAKDYIEYLKAKVAARKK
jgi:hypothetical protein